MNTQGLQGPRIALLIDFDNVVLGVDDPPGFDIELVVNALRSRGVVVLGRAYGDWYRHSRHRRKLMEWGIELVETPAFGPIIKNSADIRIALDGLEIGMTQHHINEFCLVSGDSDFLPLIKRLQYLGKTVVVISGVKFTAELVRKNCNEFISYENLLAESVGATEDATTLEGAFVLLSRTINTLHERGMEVRSSSVKQMMLQLNPVFSERNFGCSQFKQFLDKGCRAGIIKLGRRDQNSGEYTVLLPSDFDDEKIEETAEFEAPKPAPRTRRRSETAKAAPPKVQASGEDLGLHDLTAEDDAPALPEPVVDGEIVENGNTSAEAARALRRGRLRFSGKTWKGGSRSILQGAPGKETLESESESETLTEAVTEPGSTVELEAPAEPETAETAAASTPLVEDATEEQAAAPDASGQSEAEAETPATADAPPEAPAEAAPEATEEVAEEKSAARKRGTRGGRRRKTPAKAEEAEAPVEAASSNSEESAVAAEPAPEAAPETPEETAVETEKPAAKKTTRRRTSTSRAKTKKAEKAE